MPEDLDPVRADLVAREPLFHRAELGTGREVVDSITVPDFSGVAASGTTTDCRRAITLGRPWLRRFHLASTTTRV